MAENYEADWEKGIDKVIQGGLTTIYIDKLPINKIINRVRDLGYEDSFESNGYQCDFWVTFTKDEKEFTLEGDLWYEDYHTFRVRD